MAYVPNKHNVPLMKEKGDASVNFSTTNIQGAYAFTDQLALMTNVYFRQNSWEKVDTDTSYLAFRSYSYKASRFLAEGGLGYYQALSNKGAFEVYAGGGFGNIGFDYMQSDPTYNKTFNANMAKFFIQPDIGYNSEYFDIVFSTKLSVVKFSDVDTVNYSVSSLQWDKLYNIDMQPFIFIEPALTFRVGYKFIKGYTQFIVTSKLNPEQINYRSIGVNMGIELDLGGILQGNY